MSLTKEKKLFSREIGASQYFPITHLCADNIFETKSGMLGAVLKIDGIPFVTASDDELNRHQRLFHQALLKINHEFLLYETKIRRKKDINLDGSFDNDFANKVNAKYHKRFKNSSLYVNEIYLTLIYKNEEVAGGKERLLDKITRFSKKLSDETVKESRAFNRSQGIKKLNHKTSEIIAFLSSMGVKRLEGNELLSFLSLIPNGGDVVSFNKDPKFTVSTKNIKKFSQDINKYPFGNLGQYLCNKRIFFGENIQFQGNSENDCKYAAMLSLKQYGAETASVILDPLLNLDFEFILTQSFAPIEREIALKEIKRAHSIKVSAEDLSSSQIEELGFLGDLVASEKLNCGFHHNSLMIFGNSKSELDSKVNEATKAYGLSNMSIVRESLALAPSFFAQITGNANFIPRSSLITSENFADFCALHNVKTGHHKANFLNSAITLLETPQKTPVFFNYHTKGSATNPSKGHALVIGGNDSGKTTLVSFLDSQMMRFKNHRAIFLDRNQGLKIYIKAMGGNYVTISPTNKDACSMNPLSLADTPRNRDFCKSWLQALLVREEESALPAELALLANETIDYCFDVLEPKQRLLRNIVKLLPIDFPRMPELKRWLQGDDANTDGQFSWVFDNEADVINLKAHRIGFDVTYVLDNFPQNIATPVFMYIMHRIELCLDGNVTSIVVDEMWQVLKSPYWRNWLSERLPSIRKDNGHIVGMTQSPKTIAESPVSAELLDNVATQILFPNHKAQAEIYIDKLGLTQTEFNFIKETNVESRLFLYKHEAESFICKLDLAELSDEIRVFSANKASVALMETIIKNTKDEPSMWLSEFIKRSKA